MLEGEALSFGALLQEATSRMVPLHVWRRLCFRAAGLTLTADTVFCVMDDTDAVVYTLLPGGMQSGSYGEEGRGTCWGMGERDPYAAPSVKGPAKGC